MGYPKDTFRFGCMASLYMQNAIESFIETKEIFHWIKTNKEEYPQYTEENLARKASVVIVFSAMAVESFLNDYAAAVLEDNNYYDCYDSLNICNKFQLIVQFILHKKFEKGNEPYGLLSKLVKNRNELVHNKSQDFSGILENPTNFQGEKKFDYLTILKEDVDKATDAIRAVVKLVNYFEENDLETSACERMFAHYTLCYFENEPESLELKELLKLGLNVTRQKPLTMQKTKKQI